MVRSRRFLIIKSLFNRKSWKHSIPKDPMAKGEKPKAASAKATKHVKGKKRAHNEVVEITAATIDDEVSSDLPVQPRGAARLHVGTGGEVDVDDNFEEGGEQKVDEPPGDDFF